MGSGQAIISQRVFRKDIASWMGKGALAILDQGVFSAANFVTSILLARWMTSSDYGAYSYMFSLFYLLAGVHSVLLIEPMSIFGPSKYDQGISAYVRKLAWLHATWAIVVTVVLSIVAAVMVCIWPKSPLSGTLFGLAVAQGMILYFWFNRRSWYLEHRVYISLIGSVLYGVCLIGAIEVLRMLDSVTPFTAFLANGCAALASGTMLFLPRRHDSREETSTEGFRNLARENWTYGKWLILSTLVYWLTGNGYLVLTGSLLSMADAGALQALQNLINPITQVIAALGLLFMPWCSRRFAERKSKALDRDILLFSAILVSIALAYFLVIWLTKETLFTVVYKGKYVDHVWLLPYLALVPVIMAVSTGWQLGLRILQQTSTVFVVDVVGAALTVVLGAILLRKIGLAGAVLGMVLSMGSRLLILPWFWTRAMRRQVDETV